MWTFHNRINVVTQTANENITLTGPAAKQPPHKPNDPNDTRGSPNCDYYDYYIV